jgi:hypothetical protein
VAAADAAHGGAGNPRLLATAPAAVAVVVILSCLLGCWTACSGQECYQSWHVALGLVSAVVASQHSSATGSRI